MLFLSLLRHYAEVEWTMGAAMSLLHPASQRVTGIDDHAMPVCAAGVLAWVSSLVGWLTFAIPGALVGAALLTFLRGRTASPTPGSKASAKGFKV